MQPKQFRNLIESARSIVNPIVENGDHECKDCPEHKHDHENEDSGHHEIKHKGKSCKKAHPGMEHEEWEMSQNEEVELDEANQRFGGDTNIPANKQTTDLIQSGKAKILNNVKSSLHKNARFVVIQRPLGHKGKLSSNQDKVLMATISDPKKGRIKMFSYHGTHVSHQRAMQFAKNNKLVATKDAKGNPLYAKESILQERASKLFAKGEYSQWLRGGTKMKPKVSPTNTTAVAKRKENQNLNASTEYELQDATKESLARFIGEKIERGKDGVLRLKGAFKSEPPFHGMSQKAWDAAKARREKEAKGKPKQQNKK